MIDRILKIQLEESLNEFPVVAILGPRQCGKSTLAKMIISNRSNVVYIDVEKPSDKLKLSDPELFFELNQKKLVCLDEIQRLPEIFQVMRSEIDAKRRNGRFLVLGSASKELIKQSSESLAGRIIYHQLTPFVFNEIATSSSLNNYWARGGFPSSFLASSEKVSFTWRESFIQTFLERDIPQLGFSIPSENIRRLWLMLAHNHGQILNMSSIGKSLGISHTTIRNYIDILSETFMVRSLPPFHSNLGKRLVKSPKIFLRDHGILHALLRITTFEEMLGHPVFGASWEGLVVENLIGNASNWESSFYRTAAGSEMDLVLTHGNKIIAIECKASKTPHLTRGFWNAIEDIQPNETWVIAPVEDEYPLKKDVWVLPLQIAIEKLKEITRSFYK